MELLACPACHQTFNAPITLKCGHTFCRGCLSSKRQKACNICRLRYKITPNINICLHHIVELSEQLQKKYTFDPDRMAFDLLDSRSTVSDANVSVDVREERPRNPDVIGCANSPPTFDALLPNKPEKEGQRPDNPPRMSIANEIISSYHRTSRISQNLADDTDESLPSSPPPTSQEKAQTRGRETKQERARQQKKQAIIERNDPIELLGIPPSKSARKQEVRASWQCGEMPAKKDGRPRHNVSWAPGVVDNSPKLTHRIPKDVGIGGGVWSPPLSPSETDSPLQRMTSMDEFQPGDTVRVRAECSEFGKEWSGQIGVVRAAQNGTVTITLRTAIWTCSVSDVERVPDAAGDRAPPARLRGLSGAPARVGLSVGRLVGST